MQKWDYSTIRYNERDYMPSPYNKLKWKSLEECLKEMGQKGWELVGTTPPVVRPMGDDSVPHEFYLLFKRPI